MTTSTTVTVAYTDVVRSTELKTGRGDAPAHRVMQAHFGIIRGQIQQHGGREVKTLGDGFMVAFGSARSAVDWAVHVQRAIAQRKAQSSEEQLQVRIGINTGEAIPEDDDLFGSAVVAAQRITSKAQGGQILVSEIVRGVVGAPKDVEFVERGRFRLKGFPERWRLYEVPWETKTAAPEAVTLTFMFTDVAGSTEMNERLGDERWLEIVRAHNAIVRAELAAHEACWMKSLGDGFLAAFPTATDALKCALSLQRDFVEYNDEHPEEPLLLQVGLHAGKAVKEADDYYGRAINVAARITRQAQTSRVVVSQRLKELTEDTGEFAFNKGREVQLTGVPEPVRVYEVLSREAK